MDENDFCEDALGTGPPRAEVEVIYVDFRLCRGGGGMEWSRWF